MLDIKSLIFEARKNNEVAFDEVKNYLFGLVEPLIYKYEKKSLNFVEDKEFARGYILNLIYIFVYEKYSSSIQNIDNYFCKYIKFSLSNFFRESEPFKHREIYIDDENHAKHQYFREIYSLDDKYNDYQTLGDVVADQDDLDMSTMVDLIKFEETYFSENKSGVSQEQKEIVLMKFGGQTFKEIAKDKNIPYYQVLRDYNYGLENLRRYNNQNYTA